MPSHKQTASVFLLFLGLCFAAGNIWVVAARSTIPLALNAEITEMELRYEKHPGKDDVCLLHLNTGRTLHVDAAVYEHLKVGDVVRKPRWSFTLDVNDDARPLTWSADFHGMVAAMPAILVVLVATVYFAGREPSCTRT